MSLWRSCQLPFSAHLHFSLPIALSGKQNVQIRLGQTPNEVLTISGSNNIGKMQQMLASRDSQHDAFVAIQALNQVSYTLVCRPFAKLYANKFRQEF
jgi:hypothetical protein